MILGLALETSFGPMIAVSSEREAASSSAESAPGSGFELEKLSQTQVFGSGSTFRLTIAEATLEPKAVRATLPSLVTSEAIVSINLV